MRSITFPSFSLGIFSNNLTMVRNESEMQIKEKPSKYETQFYHFGGARALITTMSGEWIMNCENKLAEKVDPCRMHIVTLACHCGLESEKFYIAPAIEQCNIDGQLSKEHYANLAVLAKFYDPEQLKDLKKWILYQTHLHLNL